jgi:hypothetical protein
MRGTEEIEMAAMKSSTMRGSTAAAVALLALACTTAGDTKCRLSSIGNVAFAAFVSAVKALADLTSGNHNDAEFNSTWAVDRGAAYVSILPFVTGVRAKVLCSRGRYAEALSVCASALPCVRSEILVEDGEMLARSTYVDCLLAVDRRADALAAAIDNAQRLAHLTTKITDPKYQLTYLHNIPENRDVVRQARELGIDLSTPELCVLLS